MSTGKELSAYAGDIHEQAVRSLFQSLETICEGAVVVDREARIVWRTRWSGSSFRRCAGPGEGAA